MPTRRAKQDPTDGGSHHEGQGDQSQNGGNRPTTQGHGGRCGRGDSREVSGRFVRVEDGYRVDKPGNQGEQARPGPDPAGKHRDDDDLRQDA